MTENGFWQSLRKKLVPQLYAIKFNLPYVKGIPDAWLSGSRRDLWLENKYLKKLPKEEIDPCKLLSVHQQTWLRERHQQGRSVGVLVGSSDGHFFFPGLSWERPISTEDFLAQARTTKEMSEFLIDFLGKST